ncbi:hypothetical protein C8F01DRAFT_1371602 [Mycena amicta]|nr:hypothetical protein C8F01DRAFT_1371602 [Mycena amicta]
MSNPPQLRRPASTSPGTFRGRVEQPAHPPSNAQPYEPPESPTPRPQAGSKRAKTAINLSSRGDRVPAAAPADPQPSTGAAVQAIYSADVVGQFQFGDESRRRRALTASERAVTPPPFPAQARDEGPDYVVTLDDNAAEPEHRVEELEPSVLLTYFSPGHRSVTGKVSQTIRNVVLALELYGGCCLITLLHTPNTMLQSAHILARSTPAETLKSLEWWWGLKYFGLFINTRYNLVLLQSNLHLALDSHHYAIVPDRTWILNIARWQGRNRIHRLGNTPAKRVANRKPISSLYKEGQVFNYYLLPLTPEMKLLPILRLSDDDLDNPAAAKIHVHPFKSLGPLQSRCHPHFFLWSTANKLRLHRASKDDPEAYMDELAEIADLGYDEPDRVKVNKNALLSVMTTCSLWSSIPGSETKEAQLWEKNYDARYWIG